MKNTEWRRELEEMPFDMRFEMEDGTTELCHATGYEVNFEDPNDRSEWWNEYVSKDGEYFYGR